MIQGVGWDGIRQSNKIVSEESDGMGSKMSSRSFKNSGMG